jgi:carboxylesterase type B
MMDYFAHFALTGDPNHEGAPRWEKYKSKPLCFRDGETKMGKDQTFKLLKNTLKGDPK